MIEVAIASENWGYDAGIYRRLLSLVLNTDVEQWRTHVRFSGWRQVVRQTPAFLELAAAQGVQHALLAIDNDGGSQKHPEHEEEHDIQQQAEDDDGCRFCLLKHVIPESWHSDEKRHCVVVPVQTVETWLLCIRGDALHAPTPEQFFDRRSLKKAFFGKPFPPERIRTQIALAELEKAQALEVLHQRRSFRLFEEQVSSWT